MRPRNGRELTLLVIGVFTPVAVLAVNFSAFVMQHLGQVRVLVAIAALISGLLLNGLTAWGALRVLSRATAHLYAEYRYWLIGMGVLYVLAWSAITSYWTYVSMQDPRRLPDRTGIIASLAALVLPFALTYAARRVSESRGRPAKAGRRAARRPPGGDLGAGPQTDRQ